MARGAFVGFAVVPLGGGFDEVARIRGGAAALTLVLLPLMFARFGLPRIARETEAATQKTENV